MLWNSYYRKSCIKPPPRGGGAYLFQTHLRSAYGDGGLIHLTQTMVLVLHRELENKVEKLKYKKLEVMWLRIQNKSELAVGKWTIPYQSTWSFKVVIH